MIPQKGSFLDEQIDSFLKKFKVYQEYEFISYNGNVFKFETYKDNGNYNFMVYRQNNITGKFEYNTGCAYISDKKRLKEILISNCIYFYDM